MKQELFHPRLSVLCFLTPVRVTLDYSLKALLCLEGRKLGVTRSGTPPGRQARSAACFGALYTRGDRDDGYTQWRGEARRKMADGRTRVRGGCLCCEDEEFDEYTFTIILTHTYTHTYTVSQIQSSIIFVNAFILVYT